MTEPVTAAKGEAVPEEQTLSVDAVLIRFDGDARAALAAALDDISYLRKEISFASLAMSYGFTRGWRPSVAKAKL